MRKTMIMPTALVAVLAVLPGSAPAAARSVDVLDFRFEPRALQAQAGDTVTWSWQVSRSHNITAYAGASFASPTQTGGSYTTTFGGGTVLYRCTLHSTIDQGPCNGMCGVISNDVTAPAAPTIAQPMEGTTVASPATITGTAPGAATVVIREGTTQRGEAVVGGDGSFSIGIGLSDGTHTLHAVARSNLGVESQPSAPVTFTVDATPPQVAIVSPGDLGVTGDPFPATGTASDERRLSVVRLALTDLVLGGTSTTVATLGPDGTWTAMVNAPHPGPYLLAARAIDAAGNERLTSPVRILVGAG